MDAGRTVYMTGRGVGVEWIFPGLGKRQMTKVGEGHDVLEHGSDARAAEIAETGRSAEPHIDLDLMQGTELPEITR